jgi:uncharacterized protein (TIGR03067 family)
MKPILTTLSRTAVLGLLLAAGTAAGGDGKADGARGDLARLKGTWIGELDGRTYIVNFNGEKFATLFEFAEGTSTSSGTITVDPARNPKHMDWTFAAATGRAEKLKGMTAQTIYQLDGDTFKFCASRKHVRPEAWPDAAGVDDYLCLVFRRAK